MLKKTNYHYKNILLTGASGFIGSYFLKHYSSVFSINNFSFLTNDIDALNLDKIDSVIHCAALVHQMKREPDYDEFYRANVLNTVELAVKAKKNNVKQFIFLSSVKVYGEESITPFNENSPTNPQDSYSNSKLEAEKKLLSLQDENFHVSIIRLPLVYGEGVKANFNNLISLVSKFNIIPLGSINNKRSLVYVGNVCDTIFRIIKYNKEGIFLASDDYALSTSELISNIAEALNKKVLLFHIPFMYSIIRIILPKYYQRLFGSFKIDNKLTMQKLSMKKNKFSVEESFKRTVLK